MEFSIDLIKNNYFVLIPVIGVVSFLYFYMTGEANSFSQSKKLKSDSIRNGVFVSIIALLLAILFTYDMVPELEEFDPTM